MEKPVITDVGGIPRITPDKKIGHLKAMDSGEPEIRSLMVLRELGSGREINPRVEETRPLGAFSNFVCQELGIYNNDINQGKKAPKELFGRIESLVKEIPEETFTNLLGDGQTRDRRTALIDLVFALRSLDVAYKDDPSYDETKSQSLLLQRATVLAQKEGRRPFLQWSDTAIDYPFDDPRAFMSPGPARDQEIQLYTTNGSADNVFKSVVDGDYANLSPYEFETLGVAMFEVGQWLAHLSRIRDLGHFQRMDPFLGAKDENGVIVASGSFSAWTFLAGWFLTERAIFKERLTRSENLPYFDRDADSYIQAIRDGSFKTLRQVLSGLPIGQAEILEREKTLIKWFDEFYLIHKGAAKRHAAYELPSSSPSYPLMTNRESMDASLQK